MWLEEEVAWIKDAFERMWGWLSDAVTSTQSWLKIVWETAFETVTTIATYFKRFSAWIMALVMAGLAGWSDFFVKVQATVTKLIGYLGDMVVPESVQSYGEGGGDLFASVAAVYKGANYFFPLDEIFPIILALMTLQFACNSYRVCKTWLPFFG